MEEYELKIKFTEKKIAEAVMKELKTAEGGGPQIESVDYFSKAVHHILSTADPEMIGEFILDHFGLLTDYLTKKKPTDEG